MRQIITHKGGASALLGVGLAGTIWGRRLTWAPSRGAANVIWEAKRGRSWYRQWPFNVAVTLVALVLVTMVLMGLVLTGPIAKSVGEQLGIGSTGLEIWGIAKWPTIVAAVALMITGLYYVAPDVRPPSWPRLTPGAMLAVIVWAMTSVGFGLYIANFGTRRGESPP